MFCSDKSKPDGLSRLCRACCKIKARKHYIKNRVALIESASRWNKANPEKHVKNTQRHYARHKDKYYRWSWLRRLRGYGLTEDEYEALLLKQKGCCRICGTPNPDAPGKSGKRRRKHFSVDHDHTTGKVRGLLCNQCNTAIGFFRDNPKLLLKAIRYLQDS